MDAGAITGKSNPVGRNETSLYRGDDSGQEKQFLHCFFIMKREIPIRKGNAFHQFRDTGVPVGKLLPFGKFFRRFLILARREKILPSQFLQFCFLKPKAVNKIIIRTKRRKGIGAASDQKSKQVVVLKLLNPVSQTGNPLVEHKD